MLQDKMKHTKYIGRKKMMHWLFPIWLVHKWKKNMNKKETRTKTKSIHVNIKIQWVTSDRFIINQMQFNTDNTHTHTQFHAHK